MSHELIQIGVECPDCGTSVQKESREAAVETVNSHNKSRHNGEEVAEVTGEQDPLTGFVEILGDVHRRQAVFSAEHNEDRFRAVCDECEGLAVCQSLDEAFEHAVAHNEFAEHEPAVAGVAEKDIEKETEPRLMLGSPEIHELLADIQSEYEIILPEQSTKFSNA
jgi:hypothetical protein